jgi:hypothetical protein
MARKTFWTDERKEELLLHFPTSTPASLVARFKKPYYVLVDVYEFCIRSQSMIQSSELVDGVKIIKYKASYATGYVPLASDPEDNDEN